MHQSKYEIKSRPAPRLMETDDGLELEAELTQRTSSEASIDGGEIPDHNVLNELKYSFSKVRKQMKTLAQQPATSSASVSRAGSKVIATKQSGCSGDYENDKLKKEALSQSKCQENPKSEPEQELCQMIRTKTKQCSELQRMYEAVTQENRMLETQCAELKRGVNNLQERLEESFDNLNALHAKALEKQTNKTEDYSGLEARFDKLLKQNRVLLDKINIYAKKNSTESLQAKIKQLEQSQATLLGNQKKLRLESAKLRVTLADKEAFIAKLKKFAGDEPKLMDKINELKLSKISQLKLPEMSQLKSSAGSATSTELDLEEMIGSICEDAGNALSKGQAKFKFGQSLGSNEKHFLELFVSSLKRVLRRDSVLERMELAEMVPPAKFGASAYRKA